MRPMRPVWPVHGLYRPATEEPSCDAGIVGLGLAKHSAGNDTHTVYAFRQTRLMTRLG